MPIPLHPSRLLTPLTSSMRGPQLMAARKPIIARLLHALPSRGQTLTQNIALSGRRLSSTPHRQFRRWQSIQTGIGGAGGASDYQLGPGNGLFGAPLPPFPKLSNKPDLIIELQPGPDTQHFGCGGPVGGGEGGGGSKDGRGGKNYGKKSTDWKSTSWKMFEAAATTAASIAILGYGICWFFGWEWLC